MKNRILYISLLAVSVLVVSCSQDKGLSPKKTEPLAANACDSIRYSNSIAAVFNNVCCNCHSGPFGSGGVDLSTYPNVLARVLDGRIKDRITNTNNPMPPFGLLPQSKVDSILCWIDKGGPQ
jgi:cytochrome c5